MDVLLQVINIYTKYGSMNELLQGNGVTARKLFCVPTRTLSCKWRCLLSMVIHSVLAKVPLYTAALRAQTRLQPLT